MCFKDYFKENWEFYVGSSIPEPTDLDIFNFIELFLDEGHIEQKDIHKMLEHGVIGHNHDLHDILNSMYVEFENFHTELFYKNFPEKRVPKVPDSNNIVKGTKTENYIYWITLTPKMGTDEGFLRDYIKYLSTRVPKILGCFERGTNEKFHAHLIVELSKKLDKSKAPWHKYTSDSNGGILEHKKNLFLMANYETALLKTRYMLKEDKNNFGYFGDYHYWDNLYKEKINQRIQNPILIDLSKFNL